MKLLNLILGLHYHTSKYRCYFCNKSTDCLSWLFSTADKQTFGSIRQQNLDWKQGYNSDSSLKEFYNYKNQPLLPGDDETEVMEVCNIPELHLYTGTINLLWNNLATRWGQEKWEILLERNSLVRQKLHGGEFEGHQGKRLMRLANKLRDGLPEDLWGFYDALGAFDTMAHGRLHKAKQRYVIMRMLQK